MAKLKLSKKKILEALAETHGVKKYLAEKLNVDRQTIYRFFNRFPDLEDEAQEHLESITDIAEFNLIENIKKGNSWAVRYWLSTRGKNRGYTTKSEAIFNSFNPMQVITTGVADPPMQIIRETVADETN